MKLLLLILLIPSEGVTLTEGTLGRCITTCNVYKSYTFPECMTPPWPAQECQQFDYDRNKTINLKDFAVFQTTFRGNLASYLTTPVPNMAGFDFRNANLQGADFRGADLRWADFRGADLRWADYDNDTR